MHQVQQRLTQGCREGGWLCCWPPICLDLEENGESVKNAEQNSGMLGCAAGKLIKRGHRNKVEPTNLGIRGTGMEGECCPRME